MIMYWCWEGWCKVFSDNMLMYNVLWDELDECWWDVVMSIGWFTWFMAWIYDVMIWVMLVYKFKFVNMIVNMAWAMK